MTENFDPRIIKRTWIFMFAALAIYAWPASFLPRGSNGWSGVAYMYGFNPPHPAPPLGWILAALVTALFIAASMRGYPLIREHVFDGGVIKLVAIVFAILSGTMEELWFRRLLMDYAQRHGSGAVMQVVYSAFFFGAAHAIWGVFARNYRVALGSMIATGLLGAALAIVYLASDRVIAPCIWAHIIINAVIEPWLLVAAMTAGYSFRYLPRVDRDP